MPRKPDKDEIYERILKSGVDAQTDDTYVNAVTPMMFYCSKGHKWSTKLGNITHNHQGCPYCSGRYPVVGETDLWTTDPDIAKLLNDKELGYQLSRHSSRKVEFLCPHCGTKSTHIISNIINRGFSCPCCSDGISYPNKFMAEMLQQLRVMYIPEYTIQGARYRYDFYIPDWETIIEMHGRQHYEQWERANCSADDIQQNDRDKMEFAINNGVKYYIVINSMVSDIAYISSNVLKSELKNIFDLSRIDWKQCGYYAAGSLVHKTAELYNQGCTVMDMSEILKVDKSTIRGWLKKATELQLCKWNKSAGFLKEKCSIILLNTKERFDSISDGSRKYNVPVQNISKNCKKERVYAGIHPTTGEPMVWRYIEHYDESEYIDFMSLLNSRARYNTK